MTSCVLDASTALGWMLDRPIPARASQARNLIIAGATPVVPPLWQREVSNGVVMAERRGRLTAGQVATLAADLEEFLQAVEVDSFLVQPTTLIETAQRNQLTAYDATYLELVLRKGGELATFDGQLANAVRTAGVRVFGDAV